MLNIFLIEMEMEECIYLEQFFIKLNFIHKCLSEKYFPFSCTGPAWEMIISMFSLIQGIPKVSIQSAQLFVQWKKQQQQQKYGKWNVDCITLYTAEQLFDNNNNYN